MNFKNIAIIGSNGFIGKHLTETLQQIPGLSISLFGRSETGRQENNLPYRVIDLMNKSQINDCFGETELVYYLASGTIPATSWENPMIEIERNLLPFLNFMEQAIKLKVKKIVFISSAGTIYGPTDQQVTEMSYTNPFSPYGINKLTMEHYLNYYKVKHNIAYDIYRVSNLYGDGQNTKKGIGIINTFLENIIGHNKIMIFGNGEHVRNYLYIKDVASIISGTLFTDPAVSNVFNTASNDTLSINQLVKVIQEVLHEDFEIMYTPTRQSDNPAIYLDNTKLLKAYPDFKLTPLKEGILKTYEYIRAQSA